ncbi:MAG: ABC transporter ATP-binding protein [Acidobacteriia bacterium]|nr:ABC transporter ATP-binding protein [Terriglobia bacterium]
MIEARGLRKSFGAITAVDGVSFALHRGETFGLLGPNGAGKTTTILLLVGALSPDQGEVLVNGATDPTRPGVRRAIGVAPQSLSLYGELTAEENLAFFGRLYGLRGRVLGERVARGLAFAGLEPRRGDRVSTFSGGMQRRLNLACALVHDPPLLLLDEPTVGVDPQSRNHVFESIEALRRDGRTILYTTHYIEEAQRLCDRVAIMDHGRILALDTVDRLIERHGGPAVIDAVLAKAPEDPSRIPWHLDGTSLRIETDRPLEDVARLASANLPLATLNVRRPDLEAVFLALTGRTLRD